jgi:hypothetical protein
MQNIETSPSTLTLEEVKEKFENWRANRKGKRTIPDALWSVVKPLTHQYTLTEIVRTLKLNSTQLKNKLGILPRIKKQQKPAPAFVECILPEPISTPTNCTLEFIGKNGTPVKIYGLDPGHLQPFVSLLLGA